LPFTLYVDVGYHESQVNGVYRPVQNQLPLHANYEGSIMSNLLLKFKSKDSPYGVTRETLKALADEMDMSETMVVHLAIARFAKEVLPAYEADDGPLTAGDIKRLGKAAEPMLPKGKVISTRSLL
jgi:hypothetical protein